MTKKQRHDRYKHAYEQVSQLHYIGECSCKWVNPYLCDILTTDNYESLNKTRVIEEFSELLNFEPEVNEDGLGWWYVFDTESRLNALAFCITMTK